MVDLLLTGCDADQFTCDDGSCVHILSRCNNLQDCRDVSDEKNCMLVFIDQEKYLRDKTPPALGHQEKLPVNVSVFINQIISISEVGKKINIQFELELTWFDSRLQYFNLKDNEPMNSLTLSELDNPSFQQHQV